MHLHLDPPFIVTGVGSASGSGAGLIVSVTTFWTVQQSC